MSSLNIFQTKQFLPIDFFLWSQTLQKFETKVEKMGRPPLNTAIPGELVKIHLIAEQIQNIRLTFSQLI